MWLIFGPLCRDDNKRDDKWHTGCHLPSSVFLLLNITSQLPTNGSTQMKIFRGQSGRTVFFFFFLWIPASGTLTFVAHLPPSSNRNYSRAVRAPDRLKAAIVVQLKRRSGRFWEHLMADGAPRHSICRFIFSLHDINPNSSVIERNNNSFCVEVNTGMILN